MKNTVVINTFFFFFFKRYFIFIYFWLCCVFVAAWAFYSCGKWGTLLAAVHGPLIAVVSPFAEHRLQARRPQQLWRTGPREQAQKLWRTGQLLRGTWDPPRPGLEPMSPALVGGLSTTAPPGKSFFFQHYTCFFNLFYLFIYFLAALGLRCCVRAFSSCGKWGYSSLQCMGFSLWWLLLLRSTGSRHAGFSSCGTWAQQLWRMGLVTPRHVGSSRTRARTHVPCISRQILNHCTTREVPMLPF